MEHRARAIGDYTTVQKIGSGSFADVWKARHKSTGHEVAIKEIVIEKLNKKLQDSLCSEITILKKANHPNIIRLLDIVEAPGCIYLVLEYCAGGDLAGYIHRHGRVPEAAARKFMQQLGSGLQVLRKNNLIHRDLKPQNLLLTTNDNNAVLKIADFGFARSLQPQGMAETLCGSPLYMAPEILRYQKYDAKADLWSVGAILFQLVTGQPPFVGENHTQLLSNIKNCEVNFPNATELHPDCIDMCKKLLRRNPIERLSFEEFFSHPFMRCSVPAPSCSSDSDTGDAQQEECLPFLLDDDSSPVTSRYPKPMNSSATRASGVYPPNIFKDARLPEQNNENLYQKPDEGEGLEGVLYSSPKTGALLDSMECIEREYVLVKTGDLSLSASTLDQQHTNRGGSPHKNFVKPPSPVIPTPIAANRLSPRADLEADDSSRHPSVRLSSLQRCARLMAELATDKLEAGTPLDSLSVQLVCLAIWKEALNVCRTWAATEPAEFRARSLEQDPYPQIEQEFCASVDRGEEIASHLGSMDGSLEMPDAPEIIFQAALAVGRAGAVEELMGNVVKASVAYAKAVAFLYFLLFEGSSLPLNPPLNLTANDSQRLRKYADMINSRLHVCAAQREQNRSHQTGE